MKIQYCSDLHLEFFENRKFIRENPIKPIDDILVLAGDIILFSEMNMHNDFFDYISDNFPITYWIPSNHEYYNFDLLKKTGSFLRERSQQYFSGKQSHSYSSKCESDFLYALVTHKSA